MKNKYEIEVVQCLLSCRLLKNGLLTHLNRKFEKTRAVWGLLINQLLIRMTLPPIPLRKSHQYVGIDYFVSSLSMQQSHDNQLRKISRNVNIPLCIASSTCFFQDNQVVPLDVLFRRLILSKDDVSQLRLVYIQDNGHFLQASP